MLEAQSAGSLGFDEEQRLLRVKNSFIPLKPVGSDLDNMGGFQRFGQQRRFATGGWFEHNQPSAFLGVARKFDGAA